MKRSAKIYDLRLLGTSALTLHNHLVNLEAIEETHTLNQAAKDAEIRRFRKLCDDAERDVNRVLFSLGIKDKIHYDNDKL